jgi:hypothetical protein
VEQKIQPRGESNEGSEGRGRFVGSENDGFVGFETLEDVLDRMPLPVLFVPKGSG